MNIGTGKLWEGDCIQKMQQIPDHAIDMVCADLPYGVTACKWDSIIPFDALWAQLRRVCKPGAAMCFTATQPFTSALVSSNYAEFKHEWIWDKVTASGFQSAEKRPMQQHESILVFVAGGGACPYNPQMVPRQRHRKGGRAVSGSGVNPLSTIDGKQREYSELYPKSILTYSGADHSDRLHPSQKPIPLISYIIKSYSQVGQWILDPTCGSATTAIAAELTGRRWVCIEQDHDIYNTAVMRVSKHVASHRNSFGIVNK